MSFRASEPGERRASWVRIAPLTFALLGCLCISGGAAAQVVDLAAATGFQDSFFGHFKRGRALLAADFDLDGRVDFYVGNPGDESFVMRNVPGGAAGFHFEVVQTLQAGALAFGGAIADYDNDGDYDLFITNGGNECGGAQFDVLFKNLWLETGVLQFEDVTETAGVGGPIPAGQSDPVPLMSANAVWGDVDLDGDVDLFVNQNNKTDMGVCVDFPPEFGRNTLWRNNDDGTFSDVTVASGLATSLGATRNSTLFDFDNDGDLDLYEVNFFGSNVLWKNQVVETGAARFIDVTDSFTTPDVDMRDFFYSFASCAEDFNNDGWQDLMVFTHPCITCTTDEKHALYVNQSGASFVDRATSAGLNEPFASRFGVMGCQIGDLNGDGTVDVFIGNGGPPSGQLNQVFLSRPHGDINAPSWLHFGEEIGFPAPVAAEMAAEDYPPFPYRTHGTVMVDVDGDGTLELGVSNGGPASEPDYMREPNRLYKFTLPQPFNYLKVRPIGNGTTVSRDGIGSRLALTVSKGGGKPWTIHRSLYGGSCFPAQNGFDLFFGLRDADTIHSLEIRWTDGQVQTVSSGLTLNSSIQVVRE